MKRNAKLIRLSVNGRKAFYIDEHNAAEILDFLERNSAARKKFNMLLELLLEGRAPRDLYDREDFEKGCEHVTAIKLLKGKMNPRIYCQQYSDNEKQVFVIVAVELLEKKKAKKLSNTEKTIIRRVAGYEYNLIDDNERHN